MGLAATPAPSASDGRSRAAKGGSLSLTSRQPYCHAEQLILRARAGTRRGATATSSLRPLVLYMTPLDRGSPAGVTWLRTANEARATACHTCSPVSPGRALPSWSRIVL